MVPPLLPIRPFIFKLFYLNVSFLSTAKFKGKGNVSNSQKLGFLATYAGPEQFGSVQLVTIRYESFGNARSPGKRK